MGRPGTDHPPSARLELRADRHSSTPQLAPRVLADGCQETAHPWKVWLGYRRGHDFDRVPNNEGTGQDDAVLRADDRYVVGVVSDGVSQAFFGDLAAEVLATRLQELLWDHRKTPPEQPEHFESWLRDLEKEAAKQVEEFQVPDRVPDYLREELDARRASAGTQAVLVAFVYDRKCEEGTLWAYQVGDSHLYAHVDSSQWAVQRSVPSNGLSWEEAPDPRGRDTTILHLHADAGGRFRSLGGSDFRLATGKITGVRGVVAHSDGLPANWGATLKHLGEAEKLRDDLNRWGANDDASFIAVLSPRLVDELANDPQSPANSPPSGTPDRTGAAAAAAAPPGEQGQDGSDAPKEPPTSGADSAPPAAGIAPLSAKSGQSANPTRASVGKLENGPQREKGVTTSARKSLLSALLSEFSSFRPLTRSRDPARKISKPQPISHGFQLMAAAVMLAALATAAYRRSEQEGRMAGYRDGYDQAYMLERQEIKMLLSPNRGARGNSHTHAVHPAAIGQSLLCPTGTSWVLVPSPRVAAPGSLAARAAAKGRRRWAARTTGKDRRARGRNASGAGAPPAGTPLPSFSRPAGPDISFTPFGRKAGVGITP